MNVPGIRHNNVVVALDHSGSMQGSPFQQACQAAAEIVDELRMQGKHVDLIGYSMDAWRMRTPGDPTNAAAWAGTDEQVATNLAASLLPGGVGSLVFVTDGYADPAAGRGGNIDIHRVLVSAP